MTKRGLVMIKAEGETNFRGTANGKYAKLAPAIFLFSQLRCTIYDFVSVYASTIVFYGLKFKTVHFMLLHIFILCYGRVCAMMPCSFDTSRGAGRSHL